MKKNIIILTVLFMLPILGTVGNNVFKGLEKARVQRDQMQHALSAIASSPFEGLTAIQEHYLCALEGASTNIPFATHKVAYDRNGFTSEDVTIPTEFSHLRIFQKEGFWIHSTLNRNTHTAVKATYTSARKLLGRPDPATKCIKQNDGQDYFSPLTNPVIVKEDNILGYKAYLVSWRSDKADVKSWMAPDLGCFEIQSEQVWLANPNKKDAVRTSTSKVTKSIVLGNVDPEMFRLPANSKSMKPSEYMAEEAYEKVLRKTNDASKASAASQTERTKDFYKVFNEKYTEVTN